MKQKGGQRGGGNRRQQQSYAAGGKGDLGALPRGPSGRSGDDDYHSRGGGGGGRDRDDRAGGGRGGRDDRGGRGGYDREDRGGRGGYDREDRGGRGGYDREDRGGRGGYDREERGGERGGERSRGHNKEDYQQRGEYEERVKHPIPDVPPFTAFVGNIPYDIDAAAIGEWLGNDGIKEVRCKRKNAYVDFVDRDALVAALALDGQEFAGRRIRMDVAEPPRAPSSSSFGGENKSKRKKKKSFWRRDVSYRALRRR